jgi:hypothetical protein
MPTPYYQHELFEVNEHLEIEEYEIEGLGTILQVDNFYKYADDINTMLNNSWVQNFKTVGHNKSYNFKDYYDCRLTIENNFGNHPNDMNNEKFIWRLIQNHLKYKPVTRHELARFNLFKWLKVPEQRFQMYPHTDSPSKVAAIVYLDYASSGGTAFYNSYGKMNIEDDIKYIEAKDIRVDTEALDNRLAVVPAKFNRLVIYPGWFMHGGYIEDHSVYTDDTWRLNQVFFVDIDKGVKVK